jgi:hypothetical protein
MSATDTFLIIDRPCDEAVAWLNDQVNRSGLSMIRTFDLQVARQAQVDCPCPHHGTEQCDCQMVVLLVYQQTRQPVTLIAHGYNGQTRFSLVDNPQQRADQNMQALLRHLVNVS